MEFLGWFGHYLIIFVILVAVAGLGLFAGKKWRDHTDAKKGTEAGETKNKTV